MTIEWWMLKYYCTYEKIFTSGLKKCVGTILTTRRSYSNDKYQSFSILRLQIQVIKRSAHKDGRSRRGLKKSGSVKCVLCIYGLLGLQMYICYRRSFSHVGHIHLCLVTLFLFVLWRLISLD